MVAPSSAPRAERHCRRAWTPCARAATAPEPLRSAYAPHGFLAGEDAARLDEFNRALRDPDAKAIFCIRGGYGALRLLAGLDYEAARTYPKLLVGYSDVTALHLALYHRAGWRGLSGPMVAVEWADGTANAHDAASEALFWHLAQGGTVRTSSARRANASCPWPAAAPRARCSAAT